MLATGGGSARTRVLTLLVQRTRYFTLRISPARHVVAQGASATWLRRRLTVATRADQRPGSHRIVIEGTGRVGGRVVRRYVTAVLTVVDTRERFTIGGDLAAPLQPGSGAPSMSS